MSSKRSASTAKKTLSGFAVPGSEVIATTIADAGSLTAEALEKSGIPFLSLLGFSINKGIQKAFAQAHLTNFTIEQAVYTYIATQRLINYVGDRKVECVSRFPEFLRLQTLNKKLYSIISDFSHLSIFRDVVLDAFSKAVSLYTGEQIAIELSSRAYDIEVDFKTVIKILHRLESTTALSKAATAIAGATKSTDFDNADIKSVVTKILEELKKSVPRPGKSGNTRETLNMQLYEFATSYLVDLFNATLTREEQDIVLEFKANLAAYARARDKASFRFSSEDETVLLKKVLNFLRQDFMGLINQITEIITYINIYSTHIIAQMSGINCEKMEIDIGENFRKQRVPRTQRRGPKSAQVRQQGQRGPSTQRAHVRQQGQRGPSTQVRQQGQRGPSTQVRQQSQRGTQSFNVVQREQSFGPFIGASAK
jgi:hypothetical protein